MIAHGDLSVFDCKTRVDDGYKKRAESIFSHLNNSARVGCDVSRNLIEEWFANIPVSERGELRSRFRCGEDTKFSSAFHELTLHELFLRLSCKPCHHPILANITTRPDFGVTEPDGFEFLLEAKTSTAVSTGPDSNPRRNRVLDLLQEFKVPGVTLGIDELTPGNRDLRGTVLRRHITESIKKRDQSDSRRFSIPPLETRDGWKIRLTSIPRSGNEIRRTILYEAWARIGVRPANRLREALIEKAGRYGARLDLPFVIAINSFDGVLASRDYEEALFGKGSLWGAPGSHRFGRVSAVLFTKNLWPQTVLMGLVESRLYLNPLAEKPYRGALTKLDAFRFERGSWQCYPGSSINQLLNIPSLDSSVWN